MNEKFTKRFGLVRVCGNGRGKLFLSLIVAIAVFVLMACSKSTDLCVADLVAINHTDRVVMAYRVLAENEDYRDWIYVDQYIMPSRADDNGGRKKSCLYRPKLNGSDALYLRESIVVQWQIESPAGFDKAGDDDWYKATVRIPSDLPKGNLTLRLNFLPGNSVRVQIRANSRKNGQMLGEYDAAVVQGERDIGHTEPNFGRHAY
ncbi:TPA: hypothetical protein ACYLIB_003920 [Burkholderia cenocepacia]